MRGALYDVGQSQSTSCRKWGGWKLKYPIWSSWGKGAMESWPVGPGPGSKISCGNEIRSYLCILDVGWRCLSPKIRVSNRCLAGCQVRMHERDKVQRTRVNSDPHLKELHLTELQSWQVCSLFTVASANSLVANNMSQLTIKSYLCYLLFVYLSGFLH